MKYLDTEIFKINWIKLHNFMGIDGELYIDFKDTEEFIGDNGAGKSTILDAIAFVFCYTDAFGNGTSKVDFSFANQLATETFVEMEARLDNVNTIIKRNYSVSATGKQTSSLFVDHREIKQTEWKKMYDKDIFLSLINPKYISGLTTKAAKEILLKFVEMKDISISDILLKMEEEAMEFLNEELAEQEMDVIQEHFESELKHNKDLVKDKKAEIKKLKLTPKVVLEGDFEFNIKGLLYTEEAAFNKVVEDYADSSTEVNKKAIKIFMEQKVQKALMLEQERNYKKSLVEIDLLEKEIDELEKEAEKINKKLKYVSDFYEVVLNEINITSKVPDLALSFKDSLGKEAFEIRYKGVPLAACSFAEQVQAGILLSDFFMHYVEINYPILIDNAECITSIPKLLNEFHQMVSFSVEKGISLSRYVGDVVEDLKTLKTMPRGHIKGRVKTRLLGTDFSSANED